MNFKKWVKSIQTAGYNGARTVLIYLALEIIEHCLEENKPRQEMENYHNMSDQFFRKCSCNSLPHQAKKLSDESILHRLLCLQNKI